MQMSTQRWRISLPSSSPFQLMCLLPLDGRPRRVPIASHGSTCCPSGPSSSTARRGIKHREQKWPTDKSLLRLIDKSTNKTEATEIDGRVVGSHLNAIGVLKIRLELQMRGGLGSSSSGSSATSKDAVPRLNGRPVYRCHSIKVLFETLCWSIARSANSFCHSRCYVHFRLEDWASAKPPRAAAASEVVHARRKRWISAVNWTRTRSRRRFLDFEVDRSCFIDHLWLFWD